MIARNTLSISSVLLGIISVVESYVVWSYQLLGSIRAISKIKEKELIYIATNIKEQVTGSEDDY